MNGGVPDHSAIGSVPDATALTKSQYLLWVGQQLHPEAPLYNMALAFTLDGPLDAAAFQRAFQALVDRSDALRTVVEMQSGVPLQRVREPFSFTVERLDLSAEPDPDAAFAAWAEDRTKRLFDLGERMFDTALVRIGPERHGWYLNQHHLITDAWGTSVLYRALSDLYARVLDGTLSEAPPLPAFADYVAYERDFRTSPLFGRAEAYWRERTETPIQPVPLYGKQATRETTETDRLTRTLDAGRSGRLREQARSDRALTEHVALFNRFATLLFAYLHRVCGQDRLAFGVPSHNRPTATFKETAGVFIEVFPLQVEIEAGETFASLLGKVQRETGMFLRYAQPGTSTSAVNRSINVLLNYINASFPDFAGLDMTSDWVHAGHGDSSHHLRLQVHDFDAAGQFVLHFDLNEALFSPDDREAAADHFVRLLDAMLADDTQPVQAADLLTDAERTRLLTTFAQPEAPTYAIPETVVHAFDAQVQRTPEAIAVEDEARTLTYRELQARADALAHTLQQRGVGSGALAAVAMERSAEVLVAYLAVLKAGGAYVPLDPSHPPNRLTALLAEVQPSVVLTQASLVNRLPTARVEVVIVDLDGPVQEGPFDLGLPSAADLAYVLYTSGSTGQPKGVMIEHRALARYLAWARDHYLGGAPHDIALFTPLTFDLTVTSVFLPLLTGGRVRVYGDDPQPGATLLRVIEEDAVGAIKLTPSHLVLLQGRGPTERIKRVILGGEDLKTAHARLALDVFGDEAVVYNEYGPTEATVGCIVHRFDAEVDTATSVPIGRPAAQAEVFLLNDTYQPVPVGVPGEIYLGGPGLARGYFQQPEETAERFVPHPFRPGERLYRTGDFGQWHADGMLYYLGRRDEQVKVNGVRIELAEIEAALARYPGVTAAVAAVVSDRPGAAETDTFCTVCGLPSTYPTATFDVDGVCHLCRAFETYDEKARAYFRSMDDLRALFDDARTTNASGYDCLMLLSGGKDSTYALCRLVEMGLKVLTFTLDNGYISEEAKANIRRVTDALGVGHVFGTTPSMNAIFVDSLKRHSNVCHGCFKTIYTLGLQEARAREIPFIVTGLSRGQFFETRLTEELFTSDTVDFAGIDDTILEARKAYHRLDDAVYRHLDVEALQEDAIFEQVRFVDFYRYCDASLDEMMAYLDAYVPWARPIDTGRSTNCLINEAGIWVHKKERGFHNYAFPYSWDVRVGHKTREETLDELDDEIDEGNVRRILDEIGYEGRALDEAPAVQRLVGYYVSDGPLPATDLKGALAAELPSHMVPSAFVHLDVLPTSLNGKVDRRALPSPETERPDLATRYAAPRTDAERALAQIWEDVLRLREVGTQDNFFDLGGDSIMAIQISARAAEKGLYFAPAQLFQHQTVAELAASASGEGRAPAEQGLVRGDAPLTPIQHWFSVHSQPMPHWWNQAWLLEAREVLDTEALRRALDSVLRHHDALRLRFGQVPDGKRQTFSPPPDDTPLEYHDLSGLSSEAQDRALAQREAALQASLDVEDGPLLRVVHARLGEKRGDRVLFVMHHLVVDGVSWQVLLDDLEAAYDQALRGEGERLPAKTTSYAQWAEHLATQAREPAVLAQAKQWNGLLSTATAQLETGGRSREADVVVYEAALSSEDTAHVVGTVPAAHRARIQEVMLTALASALRGLATGERLRIDVEGHGRDAAGDMLDVTRTVGWFTALAPFVLPLDAGEASVALQRMKTSWRALPPAWTYGLIRYLTDGGGLDAHPPAEVLFNYLGSLDRLRPDGALLRPAHALTLSRHPDLLRPYAIEVNAFVHEGQLRVVWSYAPRLHDEASIHRAAETFMQTLRALVTTDAAPDTSRVHPSDFPLAGLDTSKLDRIAALLRDADGSG